MAGPQRPARGAGGGCGVLPRPRAGLSPASRIPPLRCGRRPLRRPAGPAPLQHRPTWKTQPENYWFTQLLAFARFGLGCAGELPGPMPRGGRTRLAGDGGNRAPRHVVKRR